MITDVILNRLDCKAQKVEEPHPDANKCKMVEGYRVHFNLRDIERIGIHGTEEFIMNFIQENYRLYHYVIIYGNGYFEPYKHINDNIKQPKRKTLYSKEEAKKIANDVREYLNNLDVMDIYSKKHGKSTVNKQTA